MFFDICSRNSVEYTINIFTGEFLSPEILRTVLFAPRMPRFRAHHCRILGDQNNGHFARKCWKTQGFCTFCLCC